MQVGGANPSLGAGAVAQCRAAGLESAGRPFNSVPPHHASVAQRQSIRSDEPEGRGFDPRPVLPKLYAIGRADLNTGLRAAQVGHALIGWALQHGAPPENLVLLQVPDEAALQALQERLQTFGCRSLAFHEPDLGGALTALAVGPEGQRALSCLPLFR